MSQGIVIADAGPLIALARIERLGLLHVLYHEVCIPPAVGKEFRLETDRPGVPALQEATTAGWLRIVVVEDRNHELDRLKQVLDPGEAEAILLAEELQVRFLIIDDRKGRGVARRRGMPIIGVGGVLLAAKTWHLLPQVAPVLVELATQGYRLSNDLTRRIIELAGEN